MIEDFEREACLYIAVVFLTIWTNVLSLEAVVSIEVYVESVVVHITDEALLGLDNREKENIA